MADFGITACTFYLRIMEIRYVLLYTKCAGADFCGCFFKTRKLYSVWILRFYDEAAVLDTRFFHLFWLSTKHHELINAPPHSYAHFCFELADHKHLERRSMSPNPHEAVKRYKEL